MKLLSNDQIQKLKNIEYKINVIQENKASAKNNIFMPGILSTDKINKFNNDFYKLKLIRMGV